MTRFGFRRRLFQNAIDMRHPVASIARWPFWLFAIVRGKPVITRFATGGLRMQLIPKLHGFGSTSVFIKRDYYEPELLAVRRLISEGSVVLDIGGSFGIFALFMAEFVGPEGRVHTFEPGEFSFRQLRANIALNPQGERITPHNVAASDRPATLMLYHIGHSPVNYSIGSADGIDGEPVPAIRVDETIPAEDAARVSFIKIDVEGHEIAALEGARSIIEERRPTIMFEVSTSALARHRQVPADVYNYLAGYGYSFWELGPDGRFIETGSPRNGNIFAATRNLAALVP